MATVPMTKIGVVGYKGDSKAILSALQNEGIVEVIPICDVTPPEEVYSQLRRVENCINFIIKHLDKKPETPVLSVEKVSTWIDELKIDETISLIEELQRKEESLNAEIVSAKSVIETLEPWSKLLIPLKDINDTRTCIVKLGVIPSHQVEIFHESVIEQRYLWWREINRTRDGLYMIVIYHKIISEYVEPLLSKVEFTHWNPKGFENTPSYEIAKYEKLLMKLSSELDEVSRIVKEMHFLIPKLWALADHYEQLLEQHNVLAQSHHTSSTFAIQGWVPQKDFKKLHKKLTTTFDTIDIFELPILPEDKVPVVLRNPRLFKPFEMITNLYGSPRQGMVDPTPFITPFFAIFFALCLTDAGYGLIVTLVSLIGLKKSRTESSRDFFKLFLFLGIMTIAAGIITGGYFGIKLNPASTNVLTKFALSLKLFDPLEDILVFFAISIALGAIQISLGFLLSLIVAWREAKKITEKALVFFTKTGWILIAIGLGLFLMNHALPQSLSTFREPGLFILQVGIVGMVGGYLILGPISGRSIGSCVASAFGFDGLYAIVGVFADTLSYLRLSALGLSTGIVAGVVTTMTTSLPGVLSIAGIVVFLSAHLAYALYSCIGSFVHPTRLQFVEFFGKFYESGGRSFAPFSKKFKRVIVVR